MFLNRNRLSVHGGDHKNRNGFSSKLLLPMIIPREGMFERIDTKKRPRREKERDALGFILECLLVFYL